MLCCLIICGSFPSVPYTGKEMSLGNLKVNLAPDVYFLWKHLDTCYENEMRISNESRPVFPWLDFQIAGLNPDNSYSISIHFELTSKHCFQFKQGSKKHPGKWSTVGKAAEHDSLKQVRHEWGVMSGEDWMKRGFSFRSVQISSNFETKIESEVPLYCNQVYQPVISIREEPTPGNPNPTAIQCRLKHTEFITVTDIQNKHVRFLKRMDKEGDAGREGVRALTRNTPPIFATCTFEKVTPTVKKLSLGNQAVISSISNQQGENETTSKSKSGDDHPLSVKKLYLPIVEDPKPIEEKLTPEFISFLRNYHLELWEQLMAMDAQQAKEFDFSKIPAELLTSGITPPKKAMEKKQAKQVICVNVSQDGQERTAPTQAAEPPLKKRLVGMEHREHNTKGKKEVVQILPPTLPLNSGLQQTPLPFPVTILSLMAGLSSTFFANSMLQPSAVYPQFTFPITPPHRFGPFPPSFNTVFSPIILPLLYPSKHNQPTCNPRKRSFQNNM